MKVVKRVLFWTAILLAAVVLAFAAYVAVVAASARLDPEKLTTEERAIHIFDMYGEEMTPLDAQKAAFEELPSHTVDAFVSVEDKRFFSHHGADYRRIFGAAWHNLKNGSLKEGGSTITQQLAKNTHLTRDKTFSRKIREIKLAYDLEHRFSKQEILEMYLNKIYFGNGIYGIRGAAKYYFGKDTQNLTVGESAWLAGVVKAPSFYTAAANHEKSLARRDLVLKTMLNNGFLSEAEYDLSLKQELPLLPSPSSSDTARTAAEYINRCILQAAQALNCDEDEIMQSGLTIQTYYDSKLQSSISQFLSKQAAKDYDSAVVVLDNATRGVSACAGTISGAGDVRRQPGSVIKPVLPYAAALEEGKIAPLTVVTDEPCSFGGYCPKNYHNSYEGPISIKRALEKSSNIVAVKCLEYAGLENACAMAKRCGIPLDSKDNHLAIALGGFTRGVTPLEMAAAYSTFANYGLYCPPKYVASIRDEEDNLLYSDFGGSSAAMRDDTAYLLTYMLTGVVKDGTAKKLSSLPFDVAAKTGTVGYENGNSDAWAVAYTSEHTVAVWCGKSEGGLMPGNVLGGTVPCDMTKETLQALYANSRPANFVPPPTVQKVAIDRLDYEQDGVLNLASPETPAEYLLTDYFSLRNLPKTYSERFTSPTVKNAGLTLQNNVPTVRLDTEKHLKYTLIRRDASGAETVVKQVSHVSGALEWRDTTICEAGVYEYIILTEVEGGASGRLSLGKVAVQASARPAEKKRGPLPWLHFWH